MVTNNLFDKKWAVFAKRVTVLRFVPFVEFILLAGSMATGKVHEESDFDVIMGVRRGRVWTTWLLATICLQIRGWREHSGVNKSNRISLSHFASKEGYRFSEPHNAYWENLYQKLIPVAGDEEKIADFFRANDWLNPPRVYVRQDKFLGELTSPIKKFLEFILGGWIGNIMEKFCVKILVGRLENEKKLGFKPKLVYDKNRLEIYRDTKRIEEMIGWGQL